MLTAILFCVGTTASPAVTETPDSFVVKTEFIGTPWACPFKIEVSRGDKVVARFVSPKLGSEIYHGHEKNVTWVLKKKYTEVGNDKKHI